MLNNSSIQKTVKQVKRLMVAVVGFTVLAVGIAMIVLPGPAFIVVPLGLLILSSEFVWAKRWLNKVKSRLKMNKDKEDGSEKG